MSYADTERNFSTAYRISKPCRADVFAYRYHVEPDSRSISTTSTDVLTIENRIDFIFHLSISYRTRFSSDIQYYYRRLDYRNRIDLSFRVSLSYRTRLSFDIHYYYHRDRIEPDSCLISITITDVSTIETVSDLIFAYRHVSNPILV